MAAPTVVDDRAPSGGKDKGGLQLLVIGLEVSACIDLPADGNLSIGRAEDADVRVVDPMASRYHARLLVGPAIEVEDLDSANGTAVGGKRLEPRVRYRLTPGDSIAIGGTVLLIHQGGQRIKTRQVWSHAYFEARLIEECARAESTRGSFALLRVHLESSDVEQSESAMLAALRVGDVLGSYGPAEYQILLVDTDAAQSELLAQQIREALSREGINSQSGLAMFPIDGASPQSLVSKACASIRATSHPGVAEQRGVVLSNPAVKALYAVAERAAVGTINVLILGETAVGKEVFAEWIHRRSPRKDKPLLSVNCAALSESLLESELFGYEKGAFTGAVQAKLGLLEAADGGTLFLDEVGETTLPLQAKLLRAIETRQVLRVGATKPRSVDVRFVAATNRDLDEEVEAKRFRQDLYFRLNGIGLTIPPLRERTDEIEPLANLFLEAVAQPLGRPAPTLSAQAVTWLRAYSWPGNIRELRNTMERALLLCSGDEIRQQDLPTEKVTKTGGGAAAPPVEATAPSAPPWSVTSAREAERLAIVEALARCAGNQTRAAELLGIPRRTFCTRMREYSIPRPRS